MDPVEPNKASVRMRSEATAARSAQDGHASDVVPETAAFRNRLRHLDYLVREFFDYLDEDPDLLLERAPLQRLARDGQLALFPHTGFWMGMDTYRDWTELNQLWDADQAAWKVWED